MNIVHFEVDQATGKYLPRGQKIKARLDAKNVSRFKDVEIITIKSQSVIDAAALRWLKQLQLICLRVTGYDNVDLEVCEKQGVAVYYVPDYCADAVAEHVFALLLSAVRKILIAQTEVKSGKFAYEDYQGYTLAGKTLGLIGTGKIGRQVIRIGQAFLMKIIAYDIAPDKKLVQELGFRYVSFSELLRGADIISLHVPLVPKTHHLINEPAIRKMKNKVILINVSRGGVLDTKAVLDNIKKFRYVCLDVLEDEKHFNKENPLLKYPEKVLITPHCAFFTELTYPRSGKITLENIEGFKKGNSHNRLA